MTPAKIYNKESSELMSTVGDKEEQPLTLQGNKPVTITGNPVGFVLRDLTKSAAFGETTVTSGYIEKILNGGRSIRIEAV